MNKWLKIGTIALVVGLVGVLALTSVAFAQEPVNGFGGAFRGGGHGGGLGGPNNSLVAVAAQTLGIDRTELVAQLNSGQTIAQVAQAKGVSLDSIVNAFIAQRTEQLKQSVAAGMLSQAQADGMLATMKVNVTTQLTAPFSPRGMGNRAGNGAGFVDANGDGLCDNLGTHPMRGQAGR